MKLFNYFFIIIIIIIILIVSIIEINKYKQKNINYLNIKESFKKKKKKKESDEKKLDSKQPGFTPPSPISSPNVNYTKAQQDIVDIIGPNYSYVKKIKNPSELGVSSGTSFNSIIANNVGMAKYVGYLAFGPAIGNNFWIKSGKCDSQKSAPSCRGKDRWIHIKNIPDGSSPCLKQMGIAIPGKGLSGLIPSIMEDVLDISTIPIDMLNSFFSIEDSSSICFPKVEKVGPAGNLKNEMKCSPKNNATKCLPEFYQNNNTKLEKKQFSLLNLYFNIYNKNRIVYKFIFFLIFIIIIFYLICF